MGAAAGAAGAAAAGAAPAAAGLAAVAAAAAAAPDPTSLFNLFGLLPFAVRGVDPKIMGIGPKEAIPAALKVAGLTLNDMDWIELNEAFAAQSLAVIRDLDLDMSKVNPWGGAIALGHALGSSGTRLLTTMVNHLEATGGRYGLQTMCEAGGQANATILELL